uniref:Uncharacterized protein n=1 Tax=Chromera velia CCMP2878 TaxID=1169474 RepID=A0A0K6SA75_9ALVE|eukprot:Cvel_9504.t1-p1 / transcript=Cvel_9504.t1 / gene=Cvel_9504 / organism=Chromera_velia_CCMP2878 / gene_product=Parkin coregulated gene protein homolog, putative / transcript_product=Parkin coregulated gene protein homolog, putative / location=Cvel_scaffold549:49139-52565(-) / protein_length=302 / sequence_SO=supercontig / SO=protein_coding / is_pseudo=false
MTIGISGRSISAAGYLILADKQKKLMDPEYTLKKRSTGLLPKNPDSPFGDFPADSKPPVKQHTHLKVTTTPGALEFIDQTKGGDAAFGSTFGKQTCKAYSQPIPRAGALRARQIVPSEFRRFYDRGDLPIRVDHRGCGNLIKWRIEAIDKLDYHHYLPIFFDGLREKDDPYRFLAVYDMLNKGGAKILPVVPQLIIPIKTALNTRDAEIITTTLKVLQALVLSADMVGEALVPYYRQILPIFNLYKNCNKNVGDFIDYGQRKRLNLGELIEETLELFEIHGGEDAFINIKYMIPTYESCVLT